MEWFEDAFFLFTVRIFDASLPRANANPKKIYCVDHALARSVGSSVLVNAGHLLENLVFTALRRRTRDIRYFKDRNGREVDFVAPMPDGTRALIQVCESLVDPKTRKREVAALGHAMAALGLREGTIVTRDEEDTVPTWFQRGAFSSTSGDAAGQWGPGDVGDPPAGSRIGFIVPASS